VTLRNAKRRSGNAAGSGSKHLISDSIVATPNVFINERYSVLSPLSIQSIRTLSRPTEHGTFRVLQLGVNRSISSYKLGVSSSTLAPNSKLENNKMLHSVTPNSELLIELFVVSG